MLYVNKLFKCCFQVTVDTGEQISVLFDNNLSYVIVT